MDVQPPGPVSGTERVTRQEARAVILLWDAHRRERERQANLPTVQDLAEGLNISVEEVHALLDQIRNPFPSRPRALSPHCGGAVPPEVNAEFFMTALLLVGSMCAVFGSLFH